MIIILGVIVGLVFLSSCSVLGFGCLLWTLGKCPGCRLPGGEECF